MTDELKAVEGTKVDGGTEGAAEEGTKVDKPRAKPKKVVERSETWMALVASFGALASATVGSHSTAQTIVSVAVLVLTVGIYAYYKTDLPSKHSGVKTKAFWVSMATVVGSVALALSEADMLGLGPNVTKYAALVSTLLSAAGYTVIRYNTKIKG